MKRFLLCAALAACGGPAVPAPSGPTPPAQSVVAPTPPARPAVPPCEYASADPGAVLPTFSLGEDQQVCDLPARVIVVDKASVASLARPDFKATRAPISKRDHLGNRCGDTEGGGHAGCSIAYDRYWSAALGPAGAYLEFGNNAGNVLFVGKREEDCREGTRNGVVATCSTATHFAIVRLDEPRGKDDACYRVRAQLFGPTPAKPDLLDGDVDRVKSVGDAWVYRFPARDADPEVELAFDRGSRTAALTIAGAREPCVAFRLSR